MTEGITQENYGAIIVLEYRFFGLSNPYPDLSQTSLAVHPLENAIDDLVYFANNLEGPARRFTGWARQGPLDTHRQELRLCTDKLDNSCSSWSRPCRRPCSGVVQATPYY